VDAIGLDDYVHHLSDYVDNLHQVATLEFVAPRMHYVSADTTAYPGCCLDWRAGVRLALADAHAAARDVVVGVVDFLVLAISPGSETVSLADLGR
jgi:hypothetical protein